jgi:hypothetical protein
MKTPQLQKARQMCLQAIAKYREDLARAEHARKGSAR